MKNDWSWIGYVIGIIGVMLIVIFFEWNKKKNFEWFQDQNRYIKIEQEQFDRLINVLEKIANEKGEQKNG